MTRRDNTTGRRAAGRRSESSTKRAGAATSTGSRLVYRPIGDSGQAYPAWVRALRGKSGAYVIKAVGMFSSTIVYVGESHSGCLYETMTRHFQAWSRQKGFWAGLFVQSDNDPGTTYDRAACEVAVRISSAGRAVELQAELIRKLKPRDNVLSGVVSVDDPPF